MDEIEDSGPRFINQRKVFFEEDDDIVYEVNFRRSVITNILHYHYSFAYRSM